MENRTETEKGGKGSLMWLSAVNMQGGAVRVKVFVAGTGQRGQCRQAGWLYPYALAGATHPRTPPNTPAEGTSRPGAP
jgi:hypothetical protein